MTRADSLKVWWGWNEYEVGYEHVQQIQNPVFLGLSSMSKL